MIREENEIEPTPRAEPCIEEIFPEASLEELHDRLVNTEYNYVEFLLHQDEELVVTLISFIDFDCFKVEGVRVKGCRDRQKDVIRLIAEPESMGGDVDKECAVAWIPADPPYRVLQALDKVGLRDVRPVAYRVVGHEEVHELWPLEG